MTPEEFRREGHRVVDWIANYMENVERYPVLSQSQPGQIREQLPPSPPARPESFDSILSDVDEILMPGITHWQSPNFFAFFPANHSGPSLLGEMMSAGLGVQGMLWMTSPACTELETHVMDWIVEMLDLPDRFLSSGDGGGVIQDTASSSTLCAILAARERVSEYRIREHGVDRTLVVYASGESHSSVEKACAISGIGTGNLRIVNVDDQQRMDPQHLSELIQQDRESGVTPCCVVATVGTTSTGAVDPLEKIGSVCRQEGLWLHVDAAMMGTAAICPEFRFIHQGLESADSYCFNPHKWMFTNFDCDCFFVADRNALIRTLSILPEYLKNQATQSGAVIDYRDWQIPLGRRFRALKLWFVIRSMGVEGIRERVREHVRLGRLFAEWVKQDSRFELIAHAGLNLICFRKRGSDADNRNLLDRLNQSGQVYLTHTQTNGQFVLRMSIGQLGTEEAHVRRAWELITT